VESPRVIEQRGEIVESSESRKGRPTLAAGGTSKLPTTISPGPKTAGLICAGLWRAPAGGTTHIWTPRPALANGNFEAPGQSPRSGELDVVSIGVCCRESEQPGPFLGHGGAVLLQQRFEGLDEQGGRAGPTLDPP
jgi:hypothetical protein